MEARGRPAPGSQAGFSGLSWPPDDPSASRLGFTALGGREGTDGTARREAGFPGDPFEFEVVPDPGCSETDVRWSGGGDPPTGTGRRFRTTFREGGSYTVVARCGDATREFPSAVCPVDVWLVRAREFYGPSVDFTQVRVKESRLVIGPPGTGWTCNDVIRFKRAGTAADFPEESTLIHELGHVWEHQSGQAQLLKGFVEQIGKLFGRNPYDFGGPEGVRRASRLTEFKKEGQAEIVRAHWLALQGFGSYGGAPFSTPGYREDLRRLVEGAGIGTTAAPLRRRSLAGELDSAVAGLVNAILR